MKKASYLWWNRTSKEACIREGLFHHTLETGSSTIPIVPDTSKDSCVLPSTTLQEAITQVRFATAEQDHPRFSLTSVCVHVREDRIDVVALDAYRIAHRIIPLKTPVDGRDEQILLPALSMRLLANVLPSDESVQMTWSREHVVFEAGPVRAIAPRVTGRFPTDYAVGISKDQPTTFMLARSKIAAVLHALKPYTPPSFPVVWISYGSEQVTFKAINEQNAGDQRTLLTQINGSDGQIILNAHYLADLATYIETEAFTFFVSSKQKRAAVIVPVGCDDYLYAIMPMNST